MLTIITDSSAEISAEEAKEKDIRIVPLTVVFGTDAYLDGVDIDKETFYARLIGGEYPHTSQPSAEQFKEAFEKTEGAETLVILISSVLSGTVNAALLAKKEGGFDNVHVYDSRCTTAMMRLLVEAAYANRDKSAAEVIAILDELRPRIRLYAALDTLEYLAKGGRIKKSVAVVGGLLGVKPLVTVSKEGAVESCGNARGMKKALGECASRYRGEEIDENYPVYFIYCATDENCNKLMESLGMGDGEKYNSCCAIGSHIGPNAAGIVYVAKN